MIGDLESALIAQQAEIESWFAERWRGLTPPVYCSVDLRNSHHKIAVIDTNAFPAGFNNLCPKYCQGVALAFADYFAAHYPAVKKVLVLPELHTRNRYYLENVRRLVIALTNAGLDARAGTFDPELRAESVELRTVDETVKLCRVHRRGARLGLNNFDPDLILLNNDLTTGPPEELVGLEQPLAPGLALGWDRRRKHRHFEILNRMCAEFAGVAGIDPWLITAASGARLGLDFDREDDRRALADEVDRVLSEIQSEYDRRGIGERAEVFVKNDAGTYGIAVMTAWSGDEVVHANHKTRVKMKTGKGKVMVHDFLVQEAVPTRDALEGSPMEPVIYMIGDRPSGGFYRMHRSRAADENLNVPGMEFVRLCFHQVADRQPEMLDDRCEDASSLLMVYGALARLAALALAAEAREKEDQP